MGFRNPWTMFENTHLFRSWLESFYFCELGAHAKFCYHNTFLKIPPLPPIVCHSAGGGGAVPNFFWVEILLFLLVWSPCKISEPYDNPFWGFEQRWREEE
jgi:hypothetical protein